MMKEAIKVAGGGLSAKNITFVIELQRDMNNRRQFIAYDFTNIHMLDR